MDDVIQLKKGSLRKIGIKDWDGNETGEYIIFDLEDISLPARYQQCIEMHKKNKNYLTMQYTIIDKRPDLKGKKLMSRNEEEKFKILEEFCKREMEALDLILGEGGTKKILAGRKPYYSMFDDIDEALTPIMPKLKMTANDIIKKVKDKYGNNEEKNVLE